MLKIDWSKPLSEMDIAWLRQAGFMSEERITAHQAQFDAEVPDPGTPEDELSKDALDPSARVAQPIEGVGQGSPVLVMVVPEDEQSGDTPDDDEDDYDTWKVADLEEEVEARNRLADERDNVSTVVVTGTGKDGKAVKADLIKALRVWDQENPNAL